MCKISVIIPVYNMENYISNCIESILTQTLKEIEIICIDDGSTDNTINVIKKYSNIHENVLIYHQNRAGAGLARNIGILNAKGEYVAFMDADDYYPENDILEYLYNVAKKQNILMAGGSANRLINEKVVKRKEDFFETEGEVVSSKDFWTCYGYWRFIYSKRMLMDNGILFPDYIRYQDPVFMLNAIIASNSIWICSKCTYTYRETDKVIDFSGYRIITDLLRAIEDLMRITFANNMLSIQSRIMSSLRSFDEIIKAHIFANNEQVRELLISISSYVLNKEEKNSFIDYLTNINYYINSSIARCRNLKERIYSNKNIIIYGAGRIGKKMYDFLEEIQPTHFVGFAVSEDDIEDVIRGHKVKCIDYYLGYRLSSLVIIAASTEATLNMKKRAESLGFENIIVIDYLIENIEEYVITNKNYAVM